MKHDFATNFRKVLEDDISMYVNQDARNLSCVQIRPGHDIQYGQDSQVLALHVRRISLMSAMGL